MIDIRLAPKVMASTAGGKWSEANATASGGPHAFLYSNGQMKDLWTIEACCSMARALNNLRQVAGDSTSSATLSSLSQRAFLYESGHMLDVGPVSPLGINNRYRHSDRHF